MCSDAARSLFSPLEVAGKQQGAAEVDKSILYRHKKEADRQGHLNGLHSP